MYDTPKAKKKSSADIPEHLRPYFSHGLDLDLRRSGTQAVGYCPLCGKEEHLYVNKSNGLWDCKVCGKNGNPITFLRLLHKESLANTTLREYGALAEDRGIPAEFLKEMKLAVSAITGEWLIPYFCAGKDELVALGIYRCVTKGGRKRWDIHQTAGHHQRLYFPDPENSQHQNLWVCEGQWGGMTWQYILSKVHAKSTHEPFSESHSVVALPGALSCHKDVARIAKGKTVRLLLDNDDAGKRGTEKLIGLLDGVKSVKTICWDESDPEGHDVRDVVNDSESPLIAYRTIKDSLKPAGGWSEVSECRSVGQVSKQVEVPPFPTEVFPEPLRHFTQEVAEALPCPPDLVGVSMLAVLGTVIGNAYRIQIKRGFVEGARIYSAVIARPGERKSPALAHVTAPLYGIQKRELADEYQKALVKYEVAKEKEKKPNKRPEEPTPQQIITTDATLESLAVLLHQDPRGILFEQDELSGWTRALYQLSCLRNDCRFQSRNEWSNSPPQPRWWCPLPLSGRGCG